MSAKHSLKKSNAIRLTLSYLLLAMVAVIIIYPLIWTVEPLSIRAAACSTPRSSRKTSPLFIIRSCLTVASIMPPGTGTR